jgi:SnoaL-like domain
VAIGASCMVTAMSDDLDLLRLSALVEIGQLPSRYAFAVDSRNMEDLVALYVDDVTRSDVEGSGRGPLRDHFERVLHSYYRTMHQILGHQIDLADADHATGKVYCRAEHEIGEKWLVAAICYFDDYERRDGVWYFARRTIHLLYRHTLVDGPSSPFVFGRDRASLETIPGIYPSWAVYWSKVDEATIAALTNEATP